MIPLVIDDLVRARIREVKAYAEAHKCGIHELFHRIKHKTQPIGTDTGFCVEIPMDYRVVYSIEEQPEPHGWCHHLSMSVGAKGRAPNEHALLLIAQEFGCRIDSLEKTIMYLEGEESTGAVPAVNLLVPFNICKPEGEP